MNYSIGQSRVLVFVLESGCLGIETQQLMVAFERVQANLVPRGEVENWDIFAPPEGDRGIALD